MSKDREAYDAVRAALTQGDYNTKRAASEHAARIFEQRTGKRVQANSVLGMARRWKARSKPPRVNVSRASHAFPAEQPQTHHSVPRYDAHWRMQLDRCIVVGDVHVPTTDWQFAARVAQVARAQDVRTLCIIGDLFNMDAFSKYDHIVPGASFAQELSAAQDLVHEWLRVFDRIYMTLGNHEDRLMRLNSALDYDLLWKRITTDARFRLSPYAHMDVQSGGAWWRLTHQKNYSKIKLRTAQRMAAKLHCNVITHHEHHAAQGMDDSGKYAIVSNGGLHDDRHMAYVRLVDSTSPRMTNSFVLLDHGTAHLLTPYPQLTDWSRWVGDEAESKTLDFPKDGAA